jgi:hypothetical protein
MSFTSYKKDKLLMENWRKFLKEEAPAKSTGMSMTDQTSFTTLKDPKTGVRFMQELLKGGDLFQQLQTAQLGKWYTTKTVDDLKNWVSGLGGGDITKGIKIFAKRAAAVGSKIPSEEDGIAKKDMPFLPGPPDATGNVEDVEDALTPGGKMNVDLFEKIDPPTPNTFIGLDSPESKEFMTGGLNDSIPNDDRIKIELGGGIVASKAIPTQSNILIAKGLGMAVKGLSGGDLDAYGGLNGEILDGHHRWSATMLNDPAATIGTIARIDLDALGRKETLRYLTGIGNALGNKTKAK